MTSFEEIRATLWIKWAQFKRRFFMNRPDMMHSESTMEMNPTGEARRHHNRPLTFSQKVWKYSKIICFTGMFLFALFIWAYRKTEPEQTTIHHIRTIQHQHPTYVYMDPEKPQNVLECEMVFSPEIVAVINSTVDDTPLWIRVGLEAFDSQSGRWELASNESSWIVHLNEHASELDVDYKLAHEFHYASPSNKNQETHSSLTDSSTPHSTLRFALVSNTYQPQAFVFEVAQYSQLVNYRVLFAALVLAFVYILIIFELLHRTLAAFLGAFLALGVLSFLGERASVHEIASWIEYETICLLLGMMIIVAIFGKTGFFELVGVKAYKLSKGSIWRLTLILSTFTAIVSAFLDNVTTMLLMTPVTISLCKLVKIDPVPMLISAVLMSNIGGTMTAVGDPPVVIIVSNNKLGKRGVTFGNITGFLAPGAIAACVVGLMCIRVIYRNYFKTKMGESSIADTSDIELAAPSSGHLHDHDHDDDDDHDHDHSIGRSMNDMTGLNHIQSTSTVGFDHTGIPSVFELEQKYRIKDMPLFIQCMVVLTIVILLFFLQSVVDLRLDLAWIALLGALALMLVTGTHEVAEIFEHVEWVTLGFFVGLFILMRALEELELIAWIGNTTADLIMQVEDPTTRLNIAILVLLWVSALASAFIDNIPYVAAMIPITITLADKSALPLQPLVYALAFGACLGGNGTLIGASANVVTSGISEGEGHPISFTAFFKAGFPVMLATMVVSTIYMLVINSFWEWSF